MISATRLQQTGLDVAWDTTISQTTGTGSKWSEIREVMQRSVDCSPRGNETLYRDFDTCLHTAESAEHAAMIAEPGVGCHTSRLVKIRRVNALVEVPKFAKQQSELDKKKTALDTWRRRSENTNSCADASAVFDYVNNRLVDEQLQLLQRSTEVPVYELQDCVTKHRRYLSTPQTVVAAYTTPVHSRTLCLNGCEIWVDWVRCGPFYVALSTVNLLTSRDYEFHLQAFDTTHQIRTNYPDLIVQFIDKLNFAPIPTTEYRCSVALFQNATKGAKESGIRQLVHQEHVTLNAHALKLMSPGLKKGVYTSAHAVGTLIFLQSVRELNPILDRLPMWLAKDRVCWAAAAKEVSLALKPVVRLAPAKICKLLEMDSLTNRAEQDVMDWEAEKEVRTHSPNNHVPTRYIYEKCSEIFANRYAQGITPIKQSASAYISELPIRAADGAYFEPSCPRNSGIAHRLTAKGMREDHSFAKAAQLMFLKPKQVAELLCKDRVDVSTQEKVEWSKKRALYPTDVASQLQCDFVAGDIERYLPDVCLVGSDWSDARIHAVMKNFERDDSTISAGQDYKGFNEQHSLIALKAVMQAWLDCYMDCLSAEQQRTMRLIIDNYDRTYIRFPDGSVSKCAGTLMSGSRWTTFSNTILNYVYSKYIHELAGVTARTVHVGDDVYGRYACLDDAYRTVIVANILGVDMQINKCFFGGSSEFLRKQYIGDATYQYLSRAIATFVHSRWERDQPVSERERYSALYSRTYNYWQRGGTLRAVNWQRLLTAQASDRSSIIVRRTMLLGDTGHGGVVECDKHNFNLLWSGIVNRTFPGTPIDNSMYVVNMADVNGGVKEIMRAAPLLKFAVAKFKRSYNLSNRGARELRDFFLARFAQGMKFGDYKLMTGPQISGSAARMCRVTNSTLGADYSKGHPFAKAMMAAKHRQGLRSWLSQML